MGDFADLALEGAVCCECGRIMPDLYPPEGNELFTPPGHPRACVDCVPPPVNNDELG